MRLSVVPDNILERIGLWSGIVPTPLVEVFLGMGMARCVIAGTRLGIFEALAEGERDLDELVQVTGCDANGLQTLLNALNGFGYLRRRQGRYRNSALTEKWLLDGSKRSMVEAMRFFAYMWDQLNGLEEGVRSGEVSRLHEDEQPADFWRSYMRGLGTMARVVTPEVVRKLKLPAPPERCLDVGGGHGLFSVALCRKYPELQAEVLDLPGAALHGREIVAEEGMAERVGYREGDFRETDWGQGYDLLLLFNVIHNATVQESQRMFAQAFAALKPGGTLAVLDAEHRDKGGDLDTVAGFNELFFFLVSAARAYPEATIRGWMEEAGFVDLGKKRLMVMPEMLLTARRPE